LKFAHLIFCGVAALALPVAAQVKDEPALAEPATAATSTTTLFPGSLDIPVAQGTNVPANCEFPEALANAGLDLACVVAEAGASDDLIGVEYLAWLGDNGWRHSADVIGGFTAARQTENGCEQVLGVYPHGEEGQNPGIWFALVREPQCAAARPAVQTP
jgi:hypothetical protein